MAFPFSTAALESLVAPILGGATVLAAAATAAMALVEFAKALTRTRLFFHRWSLRRWTAQKPRDALSMPGDVVRNVASRGDNIKAENETLSELIILAAGGHDYAKALYDQPVEKMMAQIQAAANVALEFPEDFPNLYAFLTRAHTAGTTLSEATLKRVRASAETAESGDATQWKQGKEALRALTAARGLMAGESGGIPQPLDEDKERNQQTPSPAEAGKARARINNLVARKLDAFQNETRYMWDRTNQIFASVLCGLLLLSMVWVDPIAHSAEFAFRAMCCLLAGIAAPFAKDVVTGLASFGKKA